MCLKVKLNIILVICLVAVHLTIILNHKTNIVLFLQIPDGTTRTTITTTTKDHTILVQATAETAVETTLDRIMGSAAEGAAAAVVTRSRSKPRPAAGSTTSASRSKPSTCRRPPATTTCTRSPRRRPPPSSPRNRYFS